MSITIELSHELKTLEALQVEWIDLQSRSSATGISITWQWVYTWYKHFSNSGELWLLVAREDHRVIGIAPLMKVKEQPDLGFAWHQLEFIGATRFIEHLDFIIETGYEEQVISLFIDKLHEHRSRWDVILLAGIAETKTPGILQQSDRDWSVYPERNMVVPDLLLPDTVDEWMLSALSHKRRNKLRRYHRKLDEQFPDRWAITQVTRTDELDDTLEHLVHLHQTYWEAEGESGSFRYGKLTEYYRELMHCMLENGWLRLYRLDIDDEPCAIDFCYHYHGRAYIQIRGVKRDVTKIPLGDVLIHHSIEQAISDGLPEYCFGLGEMPWKFSFGGVRQTQKAFRLLSSPRVRLQVKIVNFLGGIKSRIHIRSRIEWIKSRSRKSVSDVSTEEDTED